ncbi:sulfurtransferase [Exiguobacterium sp. s196]|uniref:sulfurtransferase n=1 Tax=Exiguobacterium sp. s196 TaxID=2751283 RepID=UPI001BE5B12D|nr:sulfurtransferase [Exiguobacterium sp. s196]
MFPTMRAQELKQIVHTNSIRFIDCRYSLNDASYGKSVYRKGHLPNAVFLDLMEDLSGPLGEHGGRHPLPSKEAWTATLRRIGLKKEDLVIIYDDGFPFAARAWWLFKWAGHERVVVLEGGIQSGITYCGETTTDVPHYPTSDYTPDFQDHMIATLDEVKAAASGSLYDSRTEDRFNGSHEPIDSKAGHIPNALLCSYAEAITELGTLEDFHDLKELYKDVLPVENPIFYCGSGVTACVNILALHALGKDDVQLYPGSYSDWISYPENEVHP